VYLKQLAKIAGASSRPGSPIIYLTSVGGRNLHDLLPLPYTERQFATLPHASTVQDISAHPAIENVSSYIEFTSSQLSEWEFLSAVAQEADCGILLDINNIFVSAFNHRSTRSVTSMRYP